MVVTQPEVSSVHNEQLIECSTRPLENVVPRISMLSFYVCDGKSHEIPSTDYKIWQVLESVMLRFPYYLPSTCCGKWHSQTFQTISKCSIHPFKIVLNDWIVDSLDVITNNLSLFLINTISTVSMSTIAEWFDNFVSPDSSWACHYHKCRYHLIQAISPIYSDKGKIS